MLINGKNFSDDLVNKITLFETLKKMTALAIPRPPAIFIGSFEVFVTEGQLFLTKDMEKRDVDVQQW